MSNDQKFDLSAYHTIDNRGLPNKVKGHVAFEEINIDTYITMTGKKKTSKKFTDLNLDDSTDESLRTMSNPIEFINRMSQTQTIVSSPSNKSSSRKFQNKAQY